MASEQDRLREAKKKLRDLEAKIAAAEGKGSRRSYFRERVKAQVRDSQEISDRLWSIEDPARRSAALATLRSFCETYFPRRFSKPWSADHLSTLDAMERVARVGGILPIAMPRGSGKTSITEILCLWSILAGLRNFVLFVGADRPAALEMLQSIKTELESNQTLARDFPLEVGPFVLVDGEPRACNGQRWEGERTHIGWRQAEVVFAQVPGSVAPGAILRVAGITGKIRGSKFTREDGSVIRPSLVVADDPQTDRSAKSLGMTDDRETILAGAIKGLAGPGVNLGLIMPCTVIRKGDLADRFLDRRRHPEVHGVRTKLIYSMPSNEPAWEEYRKVYLVSGPEAATEYYRENREAMDAGAAPAWEHNYDATEISAVQHAMNLFLFNRRAFFAEYQNDPEDTTAGSSKLTRDVVCSRISGLSRGLVPQSSNTLGAYVDVHDRVLYYVVSAWNTEFGGSIIDYGTYPKQPIPYFAQQTAPVSMERMMPGVHDDAYILAGLKAVTDAILAATYTREDGAALRVGKLLIDSKWGEKMSLVKTFCRRHSAYPSIVFPAQGVGLGALSKPFEEYKPEAGVQVGLHWRIPPAVAGDRWVNIDVNWWKSFAASRLTMPPGPAAAWSIFGKDGREHELFADHLCAEEAVEVTAKGRMVVEWKAKPGKPDNHWWDCLVGSAVAGSMLGVQPAGIEVARRRRPEERPTFAQLAGKA